MMKKVDGFKGFDHDMRCNGKQYVEGITYTEEDVELCRSGMHFCIRPLDVMHYYHLFDRYTGEASVYASVTAEAGVLTSKEPVDTKCVTGKLYIGSKYSLQSFATACCSYYDKLGYDESFVVGAPITTDDTIPCLDIRETSNIRCEDSSLVRLRASNCTFVASASAFVDVRVEGNYNTIVTHNEDCYISVAGVHSTIVTYGHSSHIDLWRYGQVVLAAGNGTTVMVNSGGNDIVCDGEASVVILRRGNNMVRTTQMVRVVSIDDTDICCMDGAHSSYASLGPGCRTTATAKECRLVSTAYNTRMLTQGPDSHIAVCNGSAELRATGNHSYVYTDGEDSSAEVCGADSVCVNLGISGLAKGSMGSWLVLAEHDSTGHVIQVLSVKVDGKQIKADTWYHINEGKLVEVIDPPEIAVMSKDNNNKRSC